MLVSNDLFVGARSHCVTPAYLLLISMCQAPATTSQAPWAIAVANLAGLEAESVERALGGHLEQLCSASLGKLSDLFVDTVSDEATEQLHQRLQFKQGGSCHIRRESSLASSPRAASPLAAGHKHRGTTRGSSLSHAQKIAWKSLAIPHSQWMLPGSSADLVTAAIDQAGRGDFEKAIQGFIRALPLSGDAASFANAATAITDFTIAKIRSGSLSSSETLPFMQVANAALDVALLLSPYNSHVLSELQRIKQVGASIAPGGCTLSGCGPRFDSDGVSSGDGDLARLVRQEAAVSEALDGILSMHWGTKARKLLRLEWPISMRNLVLAEVGGLCSDPLLLRVRIPSLNDTSRSRDGWNTVRSRPSWVVWLAGLRRALTLLRVCGVVVIDKPLPDALVDEVQLALNPVQRRLSDHAEAARGRRNASWDMLYNPITPGARRYHGRVPLYEPFTNPGIAVTKE